MVDIQESIEKLRQEVDLMTRYCKRCGIKRESHFNLENFVDVSPHEFIVKSNRLTEALAIIDELLVAMQAAPAEGEVSHILDCDCKQCGI